MSDRHANFVDYQQRAKEFAVGDVVYPYGTGQYYSGRVVAVWRAIGMVDVEYPTGSKRHPVEELQRVSPEGNVDPPYTATSPAGQETVKVPAGDGMGKEACYWAGMDRKYRATQEEIASQRYLCPRCADPENPMKKAIYKREGGRSERLLGCPSCLFLVRRSDLVGHHETETEVV